MNIYESEIQAGLKEQIENNRSVAFTSVIKPLQHSEEDVKKVCASLNLPYVVDLYYVSSILASVGVNNNDDVFTSEELFRARSTPIYKQFNFEHNEKDIFGCIINSYPVDDTGNIVESADNMRDLITNAVLWTKWSDPELQNRMDNLIAEIENDEWSVSMEALFREFNYLLVKGEDVKYVERNKDTAFLTKYLRSFGGDGVYDGYRINRVLKNYVFSGKGLVKRPANNRSIIFVTKAEKEHMSDPTVDTQLNDLRDQLAKATAKIEKMEDEKNKEMASLRESNATLQSQVDELKSLAASMKDGHQKEVASLNDKITQLTEANAKLNEEKVEQAKAALIEKRRTALATANVDQETIEKVIKTWASVSDDQFSSVVELYAQANRPANGEFELGGTPDGENLNHSPDTDLANKALGAEMYQSIVGRKKSEE